MHHAADRLLHACDTTGAPVCVGLDPVLEKLPAAIREAYTGPVDAMEVFCYGVLDAVKDIVPAVKPQIACFERYGSAGYAAYERVVGAAHQSGLQVVSDAKRGDIGTSSAHYAAGLISGGDTWRGGDFLTVNTYLGTDGIEPFFDAAQAEGAGLFALVRTSNPGGDALQGLMLDDGRTVAQAVADQVAALGERSVGERGYSLLGAVVGATKPADAIALRQRMPQQIFLVPGYGAQGGGADDVRACFNPDGAGALITASRSVIYAPASGDSPWTHAVRAAAETLRDEIAAILR